MYDLKAYLPTTKKEVQLRGWDEVDVILFSGDAYIDHPSFGPSIISRVLENFGYRVCIISQPDINNPEEFKLFGEPRLAFLVSSGNIDSMVNHYSVSKKRRDKDFYTPNGEMGKRPDRAVIRYCNMLRKIYPHKAIIAGGIEASLRRLSHYDYWDNAVRNSILIDSQADLVLYGMGEKTIVEVADALNSGLDIKDITYIRNSVYKTKTIDCLAYNHIMLPSIKEVKNDKMKIRITKVYGKLALIAYINRQERCGLTTAKNAVLDIMYNNKPLTIDINPLNMDELKEMCTFNIINPETKSI